MNRLSQLTPNRLSGPTPTDGRTDGLTENLLTNRSYLTFRNARAHTAEMDLGWAA